MKQISKKITLFLLCLSLFTSILSVPAFAAVKAGESCSKLNLTSTFNGLKYTCVKSGKKLVWGKGVKVSTPAPNPSPAPTPTPKNFSDLWENRSGIALAAWTKSTEAMINSKVTLPPVEIYRGASTPLYYSNTEALKGALTKVVSAPFNASVFE